MLDKFKDIMKYSSEIGWKFPAAYDNDKPGPSVSLLFAHISFYVATLATIYLLYKDHIAGTASALIMAGLYFVFYMMRRLTKAKFDIDDRSIDLENNETPEKEKQ